MRPALQQHIYLVRYVFREDDTLLLNHTLRTIQLLFNNIYDIVTEIK